MPRTTNTSDTQHLIGDNMNRVCREEVRKEVHEYWKKWNENPIEHAHYNILTRYTVFCCRGRHGSEGIIFLDDSGHGCYFEGDKRISLKMHAIKPLGDDITKREEIEDAMELFKCYGDMSGEAKSSIQLGVTQIEKAGIIENTTFKNLWEEKKSEIDKVTGHIMDILLDKESLRKLHLYSISPNNIFYDDFSQIGVHPNKHEISDILYQVSGGDYVFVKACLNHIDVVNEVAEKYGDVLAEKPTPNEIKHLNKEFRKIAEEYIRIKCKGRAIEERERFVDKCINFIEKGVKYYKKSGEAEKAFLGDLTLKLVGVINGRGGDELRGWLLYSDDEDEKIKVKIKEAEKAICNAYSDEIPLLDLKQAARIYEKVADESETPWVKEYLKKKAKLAKRLFAEILYELIRDLKPPKVEIGIDVEEDDPPQFVEKIRKRKEREFKENIDWITDIYLKAGIKPSEVERVLKENDVLGLDNQV